MVVWSMNKLRNNWMRGLTQKEEFYYILGLMGLYSLGWILHDFLSYVAPTPLSLSSFIVDSICSISDFVLIIAMYILNGGTKGKEFLSRTVSIIFILTLQMLMYVLLTGAGILIIMIVFDKEISDSFISPIIMGWNAWYFIRSCIEIKKIHLLKDELS